MKKHGLIGSRLFISLLALVLIVSFLFSACAKATSTTQLKHPLLLPLKHLLLQQLKHPLPHTAAQKVLKIGAVIDMTQSRGLQDKKWYDLIAKLYNDAGGWKIGNDTYQVQMITYDSQGNQTTAKDELTRLVLQDGCKFIIGQVSTGSAAVDCHGHRPEQGN